jgi:hypothetical protein
MIRGSTGQKWRVFAFNRFDNSPALGIAATITAKISKDNALGVATTDTNPTEAEDGYYDFDLTASETDFYKGYILPESSTPNIQVIGIPPYEITEVAQTSEVVTTDLEASMFSPKRVRTEEGTVEERSVDELIKADRYLNSTPSETPPWGIRIARGRFGSTTPGA